VLYNKGNKMLNKEIETINQIKKLYKTKFSRTKHKSILNETLGYLLDDDENVIGLGFNIINSYIEINLETLKDILYQFENLKQLSLCFHGITNIECLSKIKTLEILNLFGNDITDIKPLETLINLRHLNLSWNEITDIKPLETLVNLKHLDLSCNENLKDYSSLRKLINLEDLKIYKRHRQVNLLCELMNNYYGLQLKECII